MSTAQLMKATGQWTNITSKWGKTRKKKRSKIKKHPTPKHFGVFLSNYPKICPLKWLWTKMQVGTSALAPLAAAQGRTGVSLTWALPWATRWCQLPAVIAGVLSSSISTSTNQWFHLGHWVAGDLPSIQRCVLFSAVSISPCQILKLGWVQEVF